MALQILKKRYALRAFPALVLYPAGMSTPTYFYIPFEDENTTASFLTETVHLSALRSVWNNSDVAPMATQLLSLVAEQVCVID